MADPPEWIFKAVDYEGTSVVLSRATWQAKAGNDEPGIHPEIRDYLEDIQGAIKAPDLVFQSSRDERSRVFYRFGAGRGDFAGKHIVVVVKYIQEPTGRQGYVSTIYLSRSIYSRGIQLWPKTEKIP
jgi:hypothetical protein